MEIALESDSGLRNFVGEGIYNRNPPWGADGSVGGSGMHKEMSGHPALDFKIKNKIKI